LPVIFLLLFVYVFGGTLGAGLGGVSGGRGAYVNYVAPGIILLTVAAVAHRAVRLPLGEKTVQPPRRPVMAPRFSGSL
jgi:hypothetical protein